MISSRDSAQVLYKIQNNPSVVFFTSSTTCSVCTAVKQKLESLEPLHAETLFVTAKLDELPDLSGNFLIFTIPTILVFHNGKEIHRQSRFIRWDLLDRAIEESVQEKRPYD